MEDKTVYSLPLQHRISLLGAEGVGKSSICSQLVNKSFEDNYEATVADDEYVTWFRVKNQNYLLEIDDSVGSDDLRVRRGDVYLIVFALDDQASFDAVRRSFKNFATKALRASKMLVLVGSMSDCIRTVELPTVLDFARANNVPYVEVTAKSHDSVRLLFEFVLHKYQMHLLQTRVVRPLLLGNESKSEKLAKEVQLKQQELVRKSISDLSWSLDRADFSDIVFVFAKENKRLYAHRCILYARSDSFRELLASEWSPPEIVIEDVKCEIFQAIMKFVYSASADAGDFNVPVSTAKEIIEVAEKYKIYDLSHLARRYVITKAAVERIYFLLEKLFDGLQKISEYLDAATNDYVSVLAYLQDNVLDLAEVLVTILFSFLKQYKFLPAFMRTELADFIVKNLPVWGGIVAAVLQKLLPYFEKLTKEERLELAEYIREKLLKITALFPEFRTKLEAKVDYIKTSTDESRKWRMNKKATAEMNEFLEMLTVVNGKLTSFDKSQMKSKVKRFLKSWAKMGKDITKALTKLSAIEPAELGAMKKKALEHLSLVTSEEILLSVRAIVTDFADEANKAMDILLKQSNLRMLLQEVLEFFVGKAEKSTSSETVDNIESMLAEMTFDNFKPKTMNSNLMTMFDSKIYSDLEFRWALDDASLNAHKIVLANISATFRSMFVGGFKESKEKILNMTEVEYLALRSLLQLVYNGGDITPLLYQQQNATDTTDLILQVLIAANQYQIEPLKQRCEEYITLQLPKMEFDDVLSLYTIADTYHANILKKACLACTNRSLNPLSPAFLALSTDIKKSLLDSKAAFDQELVSAKIFVIGDKGVGKTSIINNFASSFPADDSSNANKRLVEARDGEAADIEVVEVDTESVTAQWLESTLYPAAKDSVIGIMYVFDLTKRASLKSMLQLHKKIFSHYNERKVISTPEGDLEQNYAPIFSDAVSILVGTHADVEKKDERWADLVVEYDILNPVAVVIEHDADESLEVRRFGPRELAFVSRSQEVALIELCAVSGGNVAACFKRMAQAFKQVTKSFNTKEGALNSFKNTSNSQTILILGEDLSGKSTIAKQAFVVSSGAAKPNFNKSDTVAAMKKQVIEYLETLVNLVNEGTVGMHLTPANESTSFPPTQYTLSADVARVISLWNDPAIQNAHDDRHLLNVATNASYVAQRLQQISHWNYIPSVEDYIHTHLVNDKSNCESQIIYLNKIFRFIDPPGNAVQSVTSGDKRGLLDQLGIVVYVVALSDYAIRVPVPGYPSQSKLHRALASLSALAAALPKNTKKLFIYFNKRDEFERLLPLVPLSTCFPEMPRMSNYSAAGHQLTVTRLE